jgi:hypothetical protein
MCAALPEHCGKYVEKRQQSAPAVRLSSGARPIKSVLILAYRDGLEKRGAAKRRLFGNPAIFPVFRQACAAAMFCSAARLKRNKLLIFCPWVFPCGDKSIIIESRKRQEMNARRLGKRQAAAE